MGKMKLSTVFELLLIFLFIAFAASRNLGETKVKVLRKEENNTKPATPPALGSCKCATLQCNCCRHFSLPLVSVKGPGCASITYLNGNSLRLTMSFGDRVLRNITLAGKKPNPVCMSLPGGVSKFCGRIYGIQREGDHFRSCLALELRALDDIEAALRVSCFTFGPQGVRLEPARPLPASRPDDEDDEDDEDDDYGLDEDSDFGLDDDEEDDTENDVDSSEIDYTGFSALSDEFLESFFESSGSKKKQTYTQHKVTAPTIVLAENPTKLQDIKETLIPITAPSTSEMPDYTTQNPTIAESQQKADKNNLNSTDGQTQGVGQDGMQMRQTETTPSTACNCTEGNCRCCTGALLDRFNVSANNRACVIIDYLPEDFEFTYKIMFNDRVLHTSQISGKHPPPICLPIRRFTSANLCVRFTNVYMLGRNFHACVNLEAVWQKFELFKVNFDCLRIGTSGIAHVKPEDGGGLAEPQLFSTQSPTDLDYNDSA